MAKKSILVVDNEEDQQRLMKTVLTRLGFEPTATASPEHALKLLKTGLFKIAIVDLIMPEMDGTELCEKIRLSHPNLPVYAMSGHAKLYEQDHLEKVGFNGVIPKPVRLEKLKKILDAVFMGTAEGTRQE